MHGVIGMLHVQTLELAWKSTEELKKSEHFVEVLKFILVIGNFLNFGTRQGAAYGYKLAVLPKVCSQEGKNLVIFAKVLYAKGVKTW